MTKKQKKLAKIKWGRAKDDRRESKCGRFAIVKHDDGDYEVTDARTGKSCFSMTLSCVKDWADEHQHDEWPRVYETYDPDKGFDSIRITDGPCAFNQRVAVVRYRVTVEPFDDPPEVVAERIKKLWRECDNHHLWMPIRAVAKQYGVQLDDAERGKDAKPRW